MFSQNTLKIKCGFDKSFSTENRIQYKIVKVLKRKNVMLKAFPIPYRGIHGFRI